MKKLLLALFVVTVGLIGCNKTPTREPVNLQGGRPGAYGPNGQTNGPRGPIGPINGLNGQNLWGEVTDPNLNANVHDFIGANGQVGNVGYTQNTGVFFQGQVGFQNNMNINQALQSGQSVQIMPQGVLKLEIWDDLVGQPDTNGQQIPQIAISFSQVQGMVSAQSTQLQFRDSYGTLSLVGSIVGDQFQGRMTYNNNAGERQLGQFQIQACGIFRCQ